jgi:hypothetical protein
VRKKFTYVWNVNGWDAYGWCSVAKCSHSDSDPRLVKREIRICFVINISNLESCFFWGAASEVAGVISEMDWRSVDGQVAYTVEEWKTNLTSLAILFHFLCAQHVSDINISIIRSLWLCCWITPSVVLFSVRCVLEIWCGWFWVVFVLQAEACHL